METLPFSLFTLHSFINILYQHLSRGFVAEVRGVDAEVIALGSAPGLAAVVVVVGSTAAVGLLDELGSLLGGDALLLDHASRAVFEVGGEEEVDAVGIVAQDIVGAAADEDARLTLGQVANDVALYLEQGVVAQV